LVTHIWKKNNLKRIPFQYFKLFFTVLIIGFTSQLMLIWFYWLLYCWIKGSHQRQVLQQQKLSQQSSMMPD